MPNIHEWGQKIKFLLEGGIHEWGLVVIVFLVAFSSFGLGRLSALEEVQPPVSIAQASVDARPRALVSGGLLMAARTGNAYYYPWCSGAAKILPQNQIWFASEKSARAAGYQPAKNCQGLE
ncbi:MAG: hypothetical protein AAB804_02590 [Patescibacteria group bacterium]